MKKIILASTVIASLLVACTSTKETASTTPEATLTCTDATVTYAKDIKPILEANCTKCHNGGQVEFNFNKLEDIKLAISKEEFLESIKHMKGFPAMPKNASKLSQATIDKMECWINNGMK